MNLGFQSAWLILTVAIPGITFLTTFWCLNLVLGINISAIDKLANSQILILGAVITVGFALQFFGIFMEDLFFKLGLYKHNDDEFQSAFDERYQIRAKIDPQKDTVVEYTLGQFFMSHNIAVGMTLNLIWAIVYVVVSRSVERNTVMVGIFLIITALSWYVPQNRYSQVCKVLHSKANNLTTK